MLWFMKKVVWFLMERFGYEIIEICGIEFDVFMVDEVIYFVGFCIIDEI